MARLASILGAELSGDAGLAEGELSIGDDAAVVVAPAGHLVVSVDTAVAGVHADLAVTGLDDLGFKALTAAVSDLAAMGADPLHSLVALCVPPGSEAAGVVTTLAEGVAEASRASRCPVIGGDLTSAPVVMVSVTVLGSVDRGAGAAGGALTRSGARPGDALLVTGPLGAAAAGLRILRTTGADSGAHLALALDLGEEAAAVRAHRRPSARLAEGKIARQSGASAALDVSDGLSLDLHRLAAASGVGLVLETVPVAPAATLEEALGGGDDYELVLATADPAALRASFDAAGLRPPIEIGHCVEDPEVRLLEGRAFEPAGWQLDLGA